jgi:hypothetical protein
MKTALFKLTCIGLILLMNACSKDDPKPANQIADEDGLTIDLEWSTGGSISQSLADLDLDLYLRKGTQLVDQSIYGSQFENVSLSGLYSDGDYTVEIEVLDGVSASYTLFVEGIKSSSKKSYSGTISVSENGATITCVTISKKGNTYTISQ